MNAALWTVQVLVGLLFLFAGTMKFVMPVAEMTKQTPMVPGWFLHCIGVLELAGGLGLILPGLLNLRTYLTPAAAVGLLFIMFGAIGSAITMGGIAMVPLPVAVGALLAFVAAGRIWLAPYSRA